MSFCTDFDVIIVGGGHAGVEALFSSTNIGASTLLITHDKDQLGEMSCNPAIGGIGKGHLVKEIDALGGIMASIIDKSGIQFRTLNKRKGPAVQATRVQADRELYKKEIKKIILNVKNGTILEDSVADLIIKDNKICGVVTERGNTFKAKSVVFTVGTFLDGIIHVGNEKKEGGRINSCSSKSLAKNFKKFPFRINRLKTGTPARINKDTVDFSCMQKQPGDPNTKNFSFWSIKDERPKQVPCYITYTNEKTHEIIKNNLHLSAMYSGEITGVGPRYCPAIEDKIVRFSDKDKHQVFVEPEGLTSNLIYPNGISTSLPREVQEKFIKSIDGFGDAKIFQYGYAIEYDYFDPRDLKPTLESKIIKNLFFAGQINGTTGYEEAGAQGLLAGVNAAGLALGKSLWFPKRSDAYLGVLIDDLITLGTKEPYRMFSSRAEYRLLLREDNADLRLTKIARELGLISDTKWEKFLLKKEMIDKIENKIYSFLVKPKSNIFEKLNHKLSKPLEKEYFANDLLKRIEIDYKDFANEDCFSSLKKENNLKYFDDAFKQVEIKIKYAGYIKRQEDEINRLTKYENTKLDPNFDYDKVYGLSNEVKEKLKNHKPDSIAQASRISGVTMASISLLLVYLKKNKDVLFESEYVE